jgi:hypothetical protein
MQGVQQYAPLIAYQLCSFSSRDQARLEFRSGAP